MVGQSAEASVTPSPLLMKTGSSNRLRLKPTHGATTKAAVTSPIPRVANRRFQVRVLASRTMGTRMNTTSRASSSRPSMATPSDAPSPMARGRVGRFQNR